MVELFRSALYGGGGGVQVVAQTAEHCGEWLAFCSQPAGQTAPLVIGFSSSAMIRNSAESHS